MEPSILTFDTVRYPVRQIVQRMIEHDALERMPDFEPATMKNDQDTPWHTAFYARFDLLEQVYLDLVQELGVNCDEHLIQRTPTFRVHWRGGTAVSTWHRDSEFGHSQAETNYWLPLTSAFDTNALWIEGRPISVNYGQVVQFDGANTLHGNQINRTDIERVSFDFRTIRKLDFRPSANKTVTAGIDFSTEAYWHDLSPQFGTGAPQNASDSR